MFWREGPKIILRGYILNLPALYGRVILGWSCSVLFALELWREVRWAGHRICISTIVFSAIVHVHDDYDGYYIDFFEVISAAFWAYLPAFILPQVHIIAVIVFEIFVAFFVFSVNHCGRDVQVTFDCFGYIKPLVLYNSQYHDDHHVYRRGNYAEMLPILDHIFGTAIVLESRRPLPAQKNWKKAQKVKTAVKVAAAFRRGGSNRAKGQEANLQGSHRPILQRAYDSISGSSRFVEAFHLLCEEEDDCRPQFERLKAKDAQKRTTLT